MHLKQLKLAGFKSFVDPTVIPFTSQLVAVVGPNGCGKSNIIDAVRWVMGESSAKSLRGESMIDVIFNGSSQRKAIGQASVELIFDNSMGRLGGQFTSYQEISIKRLVTRDGESIYYLNGCRCRRRDITDVFLDTGAARDCAVISQGDVSRLVEARPEHLRAYFEEAAGVSKYKERRRETVLRITHTRENLMRVADIREELTKQLQRLEHQAETAHRYKALKSDERLYRLEILALKWQALTKEQVSKQSEIKRLSLDYEQHQAKVAGLYKQSTLLREKWHEDNDILQQRQTHFYQLATEIARLEESLQQHQREVKRLMADKQQLQLDWQMVNGQLQQDHETKQASVTALQLLEENLHSLKLDLASKQKIYEEKRQQQASWLVQVQQLQITLSQAEAELELADMRLQHNQQRREQIECQLQKIADEQKNLFVPNEATDLQAQQEILSAQRTQLELDEAQYQQMIINSSLRRQQLTETEQLLHQAQDEWHQLNTEHAMLLAAQQSALGRESPSTEAMFWEQKPCLAETINVEKPWQTACELVLGEGLQAVVLDSLEDLWPEIRRLHGKHSVFLRLGQSSQRQTKYPRLSDKIQGLQPNWFYQLDKVYAATTLEEALTWLANLEKDESIVTADGYWLAQGCIKIANTEIYQEEGLLRRQERLQAIEAALLAAQTKVGYLKTQRTDTHQQITTNDQELASYASTLSCSRNELREKELSLQQNVQALEQAQLRLERLNAEREALHRELQTLMSQQEQLQSKQQQVAAACHQYRQQRTLFLTEETTWKALLATHKQAVDAANNYLNQQVLEIERELFKVQQLDKNIERELARLEGLNERMESLATRLIELERPDAKPNDLLADKIQQQVQLDVFLGQQREQLNHLTQELEQSDLFVKQEESRAKKTQEQWQQLQMQEQALSVRATGIIDSLTELDAQIQPVLTAIPDGVNQAAREQALQTTLEQIKQLGAINLTAIDEYANEMQRKQYLDAQYEDLINALTTLETAIDKMDKETEQRLSTAFDAINTAFQAIFPRLFGGGHAKLELTCDNLLEAGILVMAQPPGKRNSTIHLLSGGEKAMTAVALIFAIFQLNPSPFCMLDEVDAPLDDVNVGRFCELVKEMSQVVQFLFITHNKITMELAEHLIGVTMREPGVSRIVAVDVEQALSWNES